MLTDNADERSLMRNFHLPEDENRIMVVLDNEYFDRWLDPHLAPPETLLKFCPPEHLTVSAEI